MIRRGIAFELVFTLEFVYWLELVAKVLVVLPEPGRLTGVLPPDKSSSLSECVHALLPYMAILSDP